MRRSRHSALLRLLTLVLLLRIGFDFGAHGLFPCDFSELPLRHASAAVSPNTDVRPPVASPDHCFCHSVSVGAVTGTTLAALTAVGAAVRAMPRAVPHTDRHPLDQPPRLAV